MKKYYPIMLDIEKKHCTVVGGGKVAERKILTLLEYRAAVTVISPEITEKIKELETRGEINYIKRGYRVGDLAGSFLVYVATDNLEVSRGCHQEALSEGVLINVVDVAELCDFIVPAVVKRGDLTISVSTNGNSPMLAKKLREELEEQHGSEYIEYITALGDIRRLAMEEINDIKLREGLFHTLVYGDAMRLALLEKSKDIKGILFEMYENFKKEKGVS